MNLEKEQYYFLRDVGIFLEYISHSKLMATFGETYRTPEQAELYAKEGKGIKDSLHCKRLAIDLNFFDSDGSYITTGEKLKEFGDYWESLDKKNRWGGNFIKYGGHINDPDHFERNA